MAALRIQLDDPAATYTNLDFITGRVILSLQATATFSAVTVKLEGESRSRLISGNDPLTRVSGNMPGAYDGQPARQGIELEFHRILYKTQQVFPTTDLKQVSNASNYTLPPGQYEYSFKLKFPFNNICWDINALIANSGFGSLKDAASSTHRHVKRTLPPSLGGFPGLAEIKYYVKATAVRPKFYQENIRVIQDIRFIPIESPRPENPRNEEVFAKRNNKFAEATPSPTSTKFSFKHPFNSEPSDSAGNVESPAFTVDARLPNPAILTCNGTLPLRILVRKTNQSSELLYLSTLSIELFAFTTIRAQDLTRTEAGSWILTSQANMQVPLGATKDPPDKELKIPKQFYEQLRLPNSVCPSFETCNISRSYELEVRVGLSHGIPGNIRPELIVLPLRFQVKIYSGIIPPPALLQAMSDTASTSSQAPPGVPHSWPHPIEPSVVGAPTQAETHPSTGEQMPWEDAPPTYEEALAQDIAPVNGPRTDYIPPPSPRPPMPPRPGNPGSEKGSGVQRMPSERLFPELTGSTASTGRSSIRTSSNQEQGVADGSESNSPKQVDTGGSTVSAGEKCKDLS